ncbi:MAG: hypothetical protein KTR31_22790 [Myxococcales bacterium]|nr:hypothetical protein [Myxococcales bacterium]
MADAIEGAFEVVVESERLGFRTCQGRWMFNLSCLLFLNGRVAQARRVAVDCATLHEALGDPIGVAFATLHLVPCEIALDDLDAAHEALATARALLERTDAWFTELMLAQGQLALAEGRLDDVVDAWPLQAAERSAHPRRALWWAHLHRGLVALLEGRDEDARRWLERSRAQMDPEGRTDDELALGSGLAALLEARAGNTKAALAALAVATTRANRQGRARLELFVQLMELAVRVTTGQPGVAVQKADALARFRARQTGQVPYEWVRAAAMLLEQAVGPDGERSDATVVRVARDVAWVELVGGPRLDLSRKPVPRRLLQALLDSHDDHPGECLSTTVLVEVGWPGDRSQRAALENRLWSALSRLRSMGLEPVLERTEAGYRLRSGVVVLRVV